MELLGFVLVIILSLTLGIFLQDAAVEAGRWPIFVIADLWFIGTGVWLSGLTIHMIKKRDKK